MEGIQQLFSEFMGYDEYDTQLDLWCWRQRSYQRNKANEYYANNRLRLRAYQNAWRRSNPEKQRAINTRQRKAWRLRHPEKERAKKQRYRDKHREHVREVNRRNQAARRARLKKQQEARAA